jgi:tetratricopeptide (TPR) repeat protein
MTYLSRHPRDILAMTTYASALLVLRRDAEALSVLQKASKIKPIPLVLYIKAVTEEALGLIRQAARTFSRLIVDCAPHCPTQQHYGIRRLQEMAFYGNPVLTHDARSLWRDFGRVSRLSPGNITTEATFSDPSISPWEQMRMARAQMVSDRRGCVLQVALSHSIGKRRRTDSRLMPGVELMRKMDWEGAASVFESMLLTNARDIEVRNLAALCLLQLEERAANQKAAVHCNRILKREPRHADAMLTKAELHFQRARLGRSLPQTRKVWHCDALELLSRASSIDARHPGVLFSKALAEDALGHPDLASITFRQFIVIASEELESQLSYARTRLHHLEFWALRK